MKLYEIDPAYINYLLPFAPHLFHNKAKHQSNERKYIGVILRVNDCNYFAPLSSFKDKHRTMKESIDFIKIKNYAVLNLNNMFPAPENVCSYVDFTKITDSRYKTLLESEYRFIKSISEKIQKNARTVYQHKTNNGDRTALAKRCNDFTLLEEKCAAYRR